MKTKVELDPQVADFVRSLTPEPRQRMRTALRALEKDQGDLRSLEGDLTGYCRLRVGSYRIIIRFHTDREQRIARCVFAERRSIVYELFAALITGEE